MSSLSQTLLSPSPFHLFKVHPPPTKIAPRLTLSLRSHLPLKIFSPLAPYQPPNPSIMRSGLLMWHPGAATGSHRKVISESAQCIAHYKDYVAVAHRLQLYLVLAMIQKTIESEVFMW